MNPGRILTGLRIDVLGAGVVGAAIAFGLRQLGAEVRIKALLRLGDPGIQARPDFASAYAAALIMPHSVAADTGPLFAISQDVFLRLAAQKAAGVRIQTHFELWEDDRPDPWYAAWTKDRRPLGAPSDPSPPLRPGAATLNGFVCTAAFVDMELYRPWLDGQLAKSAIPVERVALRDAPAAVSACDVLVNALGIGAEAVFSDVGDSHLLRGVLLRFPTPEEWRGRHGAPLSYNYAAIDSDGAPGGDVYFYPRARSLVLGGLREPGRLNAQGDFVGDGVILPTTLVQGVKLPIAMIDLNRVLVRQLTARDLPPLAAAEVDVGYRFLLGRTGHPQKKLGWSADGARFDALGFGGAGVTLSWGAAAEAMAQIAARHQRGRFALAEMGELLAAGLLDAPIS
ncbi:MAG TPA: hypothetical protein DCZ49_07790 [Hyphomonadaceae bacterium]|nr:hypothetical protein [Hyphomonadaceae bacterium]